ncbi:WG repeat-containing protein [Algoriphagus sp. Y33]|uniref:WG repeat-containing protein n=1 Tax=Algoriphagus sp. Y33 TaxID=2772483 RepID=UPI00177C701D|nr:WG repeat-containing protein [Algoriphagus sp. Y33]
MKPLKALIILCLFACDTHATAQTTQKQQTVKESAEQLKEDFNALKNVFKKKPNAEDESKDQTGNVVNQPKNIDVLHLRGGRIAANAVQLDADRFGHFNNGKAIIHKGTASAMINADGQFVIPYNTYRFYDINNTYVFQENEVYANGIFQYSKDVQEGFKSFMNAEGRELAASQETKEILISLNNQHALLEGVKTLYDQPRNRQNRHPMQYYYITNTGKTYIRDQELGKINNGIGVYSEYKDGWKLGYMKLSGEKLTEAVFDEAEPFFDGMAVVGQQDQFGIKKYGYINEKGELAIPLIFSIRPSGFASGFAKVKPKDVSEFQYAFINKKGEIVFKQTIADIRELGNSEFETFQSYGLTTPSNGAYVMDSLFNIMSKADFFTKYGITGISNFHGASYRKSNGGSYSGKFFFTVVGETNPKIYFSNNDMNHQGILRGKEFRMGFINLKTKTVVLPAFSRIGFFDPVSKLAYAEVDTVVKKGGSNMIETTKGYINENGEWVILQVTGSKW